MRERGTNGERSERSEMEEREREGRDLQIDLIGFHCSHIVYSNYILLFAFVVLIVFTVLTKWFIIRFLRQRCEGEVILQLHLDYGNVLVRLPYLLSTRRYTTGSNTGAEDQLLLRGVRERRYWCREVGFSETKIWLTKGFSGFSGKPTDLFMHTKSEAVPCKTNLN